MSNTFKVSKISAINLLIALGWKNAARYTNQRLQDRLEDIGNLLDSEYAEELPATDIHNKKLHSAILEAGTRKDKIEIVHESEKPTIPDMPIAPKTEPVVHERKHPKRVTIQETIHKMLEEASEENPIRKPVILDALAKMFPDRLAISMRHSIDAYIQKVKKVVHLRRNGKGCSRKGYWISEETKRK